MPLGNLLSFPEFARLTKNARSAFGAAAEGRQAAKQTISVFAHPQCRGRDALVCFQILSPPWSCKSALKLDCRQHADEQLCLLTRPSSSSWRLSDKAPMTQFSGG
jgi:hypothetical protein